MTTHSPYGPSAAHRWMRCPASVKRSEGRPNRSSPAAEEGTLLHNHAEHWLRHDAAGPEWRDLSAEQQQLVMDYVNVVNLEKELTDSELFVEHKFHLKCHPMFFGTADAVLMNPDKGKLRVLDLKCGAGVPVEVDYAGKINPQLGYYALGALDLWPKNISVDDIEIIVVQPRAGGVKRRKVTLTELYDLRAELLFAAALSTEPQPLAEAGAHCKFCLAAPDCADLRKYSLELAQIEFGDEPVQPTSMDNQALSQTLDRATVLENWIKSVRHEAMERLRSQQKIPGWCIAPSRPVRRWTDEKLAAQRLADLGLKSIYVETLVSPAQAEKAVKSLEWDFETQIGDLVEKKSSGERLMRDAETPDASDDFS